MSRLDAEQDRSSMTLEQAERTMEQAGEMPISREEIASIVTYAIGHTAPRQKLAWRPGISRLAAALLVSLLVLAAATTALLIFNSPQRMSYADAIRILVDPEMPEESRKSASGRVYGGLEYGLKSMRELAQGADDLAGDAGVLTKALRELLTAQTVDARPLLVGDPSTVPYNDVVASVLDRSASTQARRSALLRLARQSTVGINALQRVANEPGGAMIAVYTATFLDRLRELLE